jgi:hypothetical protein
MFTRLRFFIIVSGLSSITMLGCGGSSTSPTTPSAPASVNAATTATSPVVDARASSSGGGGTQRTITLMDACDPETFNAQLGPGTCVRNGGLRFELFIAEVTRKHSAGAWHFTPGQAHLDVGDELVARNDGGEVHTFTEVDEFGGGIVQLLNDLTGEKKVAPECMALKPTDFIAAGGTSREKEEEAGVEKYQCCIHPWMRTIVTVGKH